MKKKDNPFTLTFGREPGTLISRYEDLERITNSFKAGEPFSQAFLIEGVRGSGKTVLMTAATNALKRDERWVVINLNPNLDLIEDFAAQLREKCSTLPGLPKRDFSVSAFGVGVGVDTDRQEPGSMESIRRLLGLLKKKDKRVVVTIDEVMKGKNTRVFASQFQILLREEYPVLLIMTGLYENVYAVQNDPALTFLLRMPKITPGPLSEYQIKKQYREIFAEDEETAAWLAASTKGYALAFQALGALYWEHRGRRRREEILALLDEMLDDFAYRKIWESLSDRDREIVAAMDDGR